MWPHICRRSGHLIGSLKATVIAGASAQFRNSECMYRRGEVEGVIADNGEGIIDAATRQYLEDVGVWGNFLSSCGQTRPGQPHCRSPSNTIHSLAHYLAPLEAVTAIFVVPLGLCFCVCVFPPSPPHPHPTLSCDVCGLCWVRGGVQSIDDQSCHEVVHYSQLHRKGVLRRS